jgi:hypothetical protein
MRATRRGSEHPYADSRDPCCWSTRRCAHCASCRAKFPLRSNRGRPIYSDRPATMARETSGACETHRGSPHHARKIRVNAPCDQDQTHAAITLVPSTWEPEADGELSAFGTRNARHLRPSIRAPVADFCRKWVPQNRERHLYFDLHDICYCQNNDAIDG